MKTLIILFLVSLSSYAADFSKVKNGMSMADVEKSLGKPSKVIEMPFGGITWWKYSDDHVVIFDGKTVSNIVVNARGKAQEINSLMEAKK